MFLLMMVSASLAGKPAEYRLQVPANPLEGSVFGTLVTTDMPDEQGKTSLDGLECDVKDGQLIIQFTSDGSPLDLPIEGSCKVGKRKRLVELVEQPKEITEWGNPPEIGFSDIININKTAPSRLLTSFPLASDAWTKVTPSPVLALEGHVLCEVTDDGALGLEIPPQTPSGVYTCDLSEQPLMIQVNLVPK